jgi:hypothetical protein
MFEGERISTSIDITWRDTPRTSKARTTSDVKAYCTSWARGCREGKLKPTAEGVHKSNASKHSIVCPDCGWALVWRSPEDVTTGDGKPLKN